MSTQEIAELQAQIKRLQTVVAMSGKQIVELQLESTRRRNEDVDRRNKELQSGLQVGSQPSVQDKGDFVSNDDIVELVTELQSQLDILDERSIRRTINSRASKSTPIVSLPTIGNEYPDTFPVTLGDFEALSAGEIEQLARFYELVPLDASEVQDLLSKVKMTAEEAGISAPTDEEAKNQPQENYNNLARFLGLPTLR